MPSTASAERWRRIRRQLQNAPSRRSPPVSACSKPLPRMPLKAMVFIAMPLGGTRRFSMPEVVPSQETVQPRACISRATARPGITWPPVPAAMMTR